MSCIVYMVHCDFATHATCPLELTTYKYNELQVSFVTQKLNYNASCKTPILFIVNKLYYENQKALYESNVTK